MEFEFSKFTGDLKKLTKDLDGLADRAVNIKPALKKVGVIMYADVLDHFQKEQAPHSKWVGLSPVTIMLRRGNSAKPLQDTRNMLQSVETDVQKKDVAVGTNSIKARTHNYGRSGQRWGNATVNIPQREFMWLSKKAEGRMVDVVAKFLWDNKL